MSGNGRYAEFVIAPQFRVSANYHRGDELVKEISEAKGYGGKMKAFKAFVADPWLENYASASPCYAGALISTALGAIPKMQCKEAVLHTLQSPIYKNLMEIKPLAAHAITSSALALLSPADMASKEIQGVVKTLETDGDIALKNFRAEQQRKAAEQRAHDWTAYDYAQDARRDTAVTVGKAAPAL